MARFSVRVGGSRNRKRSRPRGTTAIDGESEKLHRNGEDGAKNGAVEEVQEDREVDRDVEEGADEEDEEDAEDEEVAEEDEDSSSSTVPVRIDTDVLDCPICYEPLRPPLFQCHNGHVACSSCFAKLPNKCYICSHTIHSRCLALEKVIEAIKIPCSHAIYGCRRFFSYSQKHVHEETCIHAPCSCPMSDCLFRGSTRMLSAHFSRNHHDPDMAFSYGAHFKVSVDPVEPFVVLYGADGHLFLLFSKGEPLGYALSMACIRPSMLEWEFSYELTAREMGSSLQLKASTPNIQSAVPVCPSKVYLMVPFDFLYQGRIILVVCIQKIKSSVVN